MCEYRYCSYCKCKTRRLVYGSFWVCCECGFAEVVPATARDLAMLFVGVGESPPPLGFGGVRQ